MVMEIQNLKFVPFQSLIDTSFWVKLNDLKLDKYKLDEKEIDIVGYVDICLPLQVPCILNLDGNSFSREVLSFSSKLTTSGKLIIKNTLESFNKENKKELLAHYGNKILFDMRTGEAVLEPNLLFTFVMICYADIKKYKYTYWIAFPSLTFPPLVSLNGSPSLLSHVINTHEIDILEKSYLKLLKTPSPCRDRNALLKENTAFSPFYFSIRASLLPDNITDYNVEPLNLCPLFLDKNFVFQLPDLISPTNPLDTIWVGFSDNSTIIQNNLPDNTQKFYPGWLMRNILSLLKIRIDNCIERFNKEHPNNKDGLHKSITINIVSFKLTPNTVSLGNNTDPPSLYTIKNASMCYRFEFKLEDTQYNPKYLGWEVNNDGSLSPKAIDLSSVLDPIEIASSSAKLNVKLMKWRALPDLDLPKVFKLKCLLIGAGTLGCNVARCLLAWGVTHVTFVDNGTVSYSNPVRQSLFTFQDALPLTEDDLPSGDKSRNKAVLAAKALAKIFPKADSKGYDLTVPSPGHPVTGNETEVLAQVELLESLIHQHDAIFLLTDTRESRWLPTVIGAATGKIVVTTALGFDSYLVMRHGSRDLGGGGLPEESGDVGTWGMPGTCVTGRRLGCYFCNDVVAPTNSTGNRALDQQCTVTRPGLSYVASGFAVELFVSLIQHPLGVEALAMSTSGTINGLDGLSLGDADKLESCLGIVPHQIRGFLSTFSMFQPLTTAFDRCTACSRRVLAAYHSQQKMSFLINVFNSPPSYLEQFSGLSDLLNEASAKDLMTLSSSGSESNE